MGAGWSQDDASQSQPNKESSQTVPQNKAEAVEISVEAKPRPRETIAEVATPQVKLPLNSQAIILKEESTINSLNKKSDSNCFFLNAKKLSITWADSAEDNGYWRWSKIEETSSNTFVDAAELLNVCWLEVHGKFEATKLSPGMRYEVAFVIMLKDPACGWEVPVNVRLILPDGNKQERKENLMKNPRGEWIEIPVGEFVASPEKAGDIEFSIYEYEGGQWKRGLVIKGIAIRPKYLVLE